MNSSATPTLLGASSPEQANSLLANETLDIQDQNSSQLAHRPGAHSPRVHLDDMTNHDNDSKSTVIKTEYKSNFTPFDQYVYNEITDSFVKQSNHRSTVSNNLLVEMRRPLSSSSSNQDLAAHSETQAHHATQAASPALEAGSFEPVGSSEAGNHPGHTNEPWYMEVTKRNKKANEYRLKSELGHSSSLMVEPDVVRKSPLGNDPSIEAQIQDKQQQLQLGYKYNPHEYKRDHLIAHMANNNNFKIPKEDVANPPGSRRVVINSTGTSRPLSRTTAASRARSQSSKRPPTSAPLKSETVTKSNQTTPTRTVPSRAPASATKVNSKPIVSTPRTVGTPINGVDRPKSAATPRSATSTASKRVLPSRPVSTLKSAKPVSSAEKSSKPTESKAHDLTAARRAARTSASALATKPPVNRTVNTTSTSSRTTSSARPGYTRSAAPTNKPTKQTSGPPPTGAVKSIKTKALLDAGQKTPTDVTASSKVGAVDPKLIGLRPNSDFIQALESGTTQDVMTEQTPDKDAVENEEYKSDTDLIFSTTRAGNMLADEIAQAEKAAHEIVSEEKLEGHLSSKVTASSSASAGQSNLEQADVTLTLDSAPKQLVNGLEEGLVSAEDRYESSERDASLEYKNQLSEQPPEQHDQSYNHEPYSIIPTTYATKIKDESPTNDESVVDRDETDLREGHISSPSSQSDISSQQERSELPVESFNKTEDYAQDVEGKSDVDITPRVQFSETTKIMIQNDELEPNLLHSSDSETDEQYSNQNLHTGEDSPVFQSAPSEDITRTTLKDIQEGPELNDKPVVVQKDGFSEYFSNDHELHGTKIEETNDGAQTDLKSDFDSNTELHLVSSQKVDDVSNNLDDVVEPGTTKNDSNVEPGENSETDRQTRRMSTPDEIESDADQGGEMKGHKDFFRHLQEQSHSMDQPSDAFNDTQNDLDDEKLEDHPRGDIDRDDEVFIDKNELLMNVGSLEVMESMKRQEMSQKSELARQQSGASTLLAGQPPGELVLSVNQLDEFYAHVSPHQAIEVNSAQQVEEKNNDLDQFHDLVKDEQHVDQSSNFNAQESNLPNSEETNETILQPIVESSKELTTDLLNFGSISLTNDDKSISNHDIAESKHDIDKGQENEVGGNTFDTFEVSRQSSVEEPHRNVPSKESISDSGEDIRIDQSKHSDPMTNLESDSNQATKSSTSAIDDEMDEDEQLKLSNHLTNSDDDVILEPRNRKDSLSGAFSPHRSTSPSRYNEGAGLGIMVQDDEELGTVELSDGSSAQIVTPTVAENRAEISTSKSLMPEIAQASILLHTQKLIQDNVFDEDDEGYDLNPLADPIDVAATMSSSSSVAEEMLRLSRQASLATAISDLNEPSFNEGGMDQDNGASTRESVEIGIQDVQEHLGQSIEKSRSSSTSTLSSPAQNPDPKNEAKASVDVKSSDGCNNDHMVDPLNNNEANNIDTRKQNIDINSDRNNTVDQSEANTQVKSHTTEPPAATDVTAPEDQAKGVNVDGLSTS